MSTNKLWDPQDKNYVLSLSIPQCPALGLRQRTSSVDFERTDEELRQGYFWKTVDLPLLPSAWIFQAILYRHWVERRIRDSRKMPPGMFLYEFFHRATYILKGWKLEKAMIWDKELSICPYFSTFALDSKSRVMCGSNIFSSLTVPPRTQLLSTVFITHNMK